MRVVSRVRIRALGLAGKILRFPKPVSFVGPDSALGLCRESPRRGESAWSS